MTPLIRILSSLGLLSALLGGLGYCQPKGFSWLWLDWQKLAEARRTLDRERRRSARLDASGIDIRGRLAEKHRLTREVIAGERDLFAAAARFKHINPTAKDCPVSYRLAWRGCSDGERACRQVIRWVVVELEESAPGQVEQTRRRLEAQLREHLKRHGTVKLPVAGGASPKERPRKADRPEASPAPRIVRPAPKPLKPRPLRRLAAD
jgi:hypothetical protein